MPTQEDRIEPDEDVVAALREYYLNAENDRRAIRSAFRVIVLIVLTFAVLCWSRSC